MRVGNAVVKVVGSLCFPGPPNTIPPTNVVAWFKERRDIQLELVAMQEKYKEPYNGQAF